MTFFQIKYVKSSTEPFVRNLLSSGSLTNVAFCLSIPTSLSWHWLNQCSEIGTGLYSSNYINHILFQLVYKRDWQACFFFFFLLLQENSMIFTVIINTHIRVVESSWWSPAYSCLWEWESTTIWWTKRRGRRREELNWKRRMQRRT